MVSLTKPDRNNSYRESQYVAIRTILYVSHYNYVNSSSLSRFPTAAKISYKFTPSR